MKYILSVRGRAVRHISEAADYYNSESAGLGERFRNEVASVLRRLEMNPLMYPRFSTTPFRKAVMKVFPYIIYYEVIKSKVVVIAVRNARRDGGERWEQ